MSGPYARGSKAPSARRGRTRFNTRQALAGQICVQLRLVQRPSERGKVYKSSGIACICIVDHCMAGIHPSGKSDPPHRTMVCHQASEYGREEDATLDSRMH